MIEKPGNKHFLLKPLQGGSLTHVTATFESLYGTIESSWEQTNEMINYHFVVPVNTTASIIRPCGERDFKKPAKEFKDARYEDGRIVFEVGSGEYNISIPNLVEINAMVD
ncbi:alpha-L-rhamnosidase C-terminal domain-containing protein [Neobacillus cucumis]|uniref:alpha-L-rhamnosidase C-terminal domain-containing protein n=1 Tax=Neobacillus cucumis TaxID=1740721 RepID=UPI002852FF41|nr:alpha-L-rhamnosidase C-terminal domain-containing protein [Neobacillus cucumis]MDR4947082.1 alpha-L-rhamnosidase C-terminal domain-containing protein [Neobacillus cucumis]